MTFTEWWLIYLNAQRETFDGSIGTKWSESTFYSVLFLLFCSPKVDKVAKKITSYFYCKGPIVVALLSMSFVNECSVSCK